MLLPVAFASMQASGANDFDMRDDNGRDCLRDKSATALFNQINNLEAAG